MKELNKQGNQKAKTAVGVDNDSDDERAFKADAVKSSPTGWFVDSGATSHMTNDRSSFAEFNSSKSEKVTVANGQYMMSEGVGDGYLHCQSKNIRVKDVLYVPTLESNLLSVKKLTKQGNVVMFKDDISKGDRVLAERKVVNDLYQLTWEKANFTKQDKCHQNYIHLWHRRLGHRDPEAVKKLCREKLAEDIDIDTCDKLLKFINCMKGKMTRKTILQSSNTRAKQPLDLMHTDVCGPMKTQTVGGKKYFLTFIDDNSRYTVVYLLCSKDEVPQKLQEYVAYVNNKFGKMPKVLRSDNGT
jgi:hypothetical protein